MRPPDRPPRPARAGPASTRARPSANASMTTPLRKPQRVFMTAPTRSRRGSRAAGTEEEGSSAPVAIRTMGEVALGFSSRAAAATATGLARDPETEDVDLRSGIEKAVLLAAMLTRLAATRDGAAMFTSETADMSSERSDGRSSRRRMRCSKCGCRATISANPIGAADILPSSSTTSSAHTHGHHARRDRAHLRPRRVGVAYPSSLGPSLEGIEPPHSRRRPAQGQGG